MLLKLFKYDFRASARYGVPLLIAIAAATLLGCVNVFIVSRDIASESSISMPPAEGVGNAIVFAAMGGLVIIGMALAAAAAVMAVLLLVQFYRSTVSDEAYLTFTLPVSATQTLAAKLANTIVWSIFAGLALIAAGCAIIGTSVAASGTSEEFFRTFAEIFSVIRSVFGSGGLTIFLLLMNGAISFVETYLQMFMAITFGSVIVRRHKALAGVAMIFGINFIVKIITSIMQFATLGSLGITTAMTEGLTAANVYLLSCSILYAVLAFLFFLITKYMMEKNLNLE